MLYVNLQDKDQCVQLRITWKQASGSINYGVPLMIDPEPFSRDIELVGGTRVLSVVTSNVDSDNVGFETTVQRCTKD